MKQYCRYCAHCHCGDVCYCDVKDKTMSDSKAKAVNHCKDFAFNEIDVFYGGDMNKVYRPRKPKQNEPDGQINMFEYMNTHKGKFGGCDGCICRECLMHWTNRCPYGGCYDEKRAKDYPYDKAHPEKPPRTLWSDWHKEEEQAHWCRGGSFTLALTCDSFVQYEEDKTVVKDCLEAVVVVFQDGYISCSLVDTLGCEECYKRFNLKGEDDD